MPRPDPENLKLFQEGKKRCCKCREIKTLEEFTKCKNRFNGYNPRCIECDQRYRNENKEKYANAALEKRKKQRAYHCERERKRRERLGEEECRRRSRANYIRNRENYLKARRERLRTDPAFKMSKVLRDRLYHAIVGAKTKKHRHTKELLGCEFEEFTTYIESLWKPGMTWENHGHGRDKWIVDHIIPCAAFDLSKLEDQQKCFHYTNLQPLWYSENARKSARYNGKFCYYDKRNEGEGESTPPPPSLSDDTTTLQPVQSPPATPDP